MSMTPEQILERLEAIEIERAELADVDFDELMAKATIEGGDLDAIEQQQADAERRDNRLRIEHEALTKHLDVARAEAVQPQIDELLAKHADVMKRASKASTKIAKHWDEIAKAIEEFKACYTESMAVTSEANRIAKDADTKPPQMGPPLSDKLCGLVDSMKNDAVRIGTLSTGMIAGPKPAGFGVDVDEAA